MHAIYFETRKQEYVCPKENSAENVTKFCSIYIVKLSSSNFEEN